MKSTILFILHLPPPVHGAAMMGKYIHDSKLINDSFNCHYIDLTTAKDLGDIGHFRIGKIGEFISLLRKIRKAIHELNPELIYVTPNAKAPAFYKDFIVVQMIKSMGCRVVLHYHNKGVSTRQDRWFDNKLYRRFFKGVKVILLAEALYPDVQKYVKREDIYICPNGIPDTTNGEAPSIERNNNVPHILFLSNLLVSKGVLILLDALKILKDGGYSFVCDFVGGETSEINAKSFNEEVKKRGLNKIAIYQGRKYGKEKDRIFDNADIFTLPSLNEAFPLVNLEAMQHKLPIVSSNVGGIVEEVKNGENGYITKAGDDKTLADALGKLIDNKGLRIKLGNKSYEMYRQSFTKDKFEFNIEGILTNCLEEY
ncbi:D-inositol-3-phosphate glycosyltransferase [Segatella buccae]|uniref:D-inositol-3-phosphate glycosyltransferase n=1 Tax=Segatella buccae TaxID=28126 RepID=A0AAQ1ZLF8_9BACT|nr:glycosyltransferase family 4 protein [Segatella buccae]SUB96678.1 D-inositol-3-phosphate glycosyltransferase [Segatella buccae]